MAPKRSAVKGKASGAAVDGAEVQEWKSSKCTDSHLLSMVESHLLQPQNVIHWRRSNGVSFPHEEENESVVFFLMFFVALVFQFLISSEAFFITGGSKCIT